MFFVNTSNARAFFSGFVTAFLIVLCLGPPLLDSLDIVLENRTVQRLRYALDKTQALPTMPVILFLGSSHSYRGLIASDIEQELHRNGFEYNVVDLTIGGMGILEQDYYLDLYLRKTPIIPEIVFFEVSERFEDPIREYTRGGVDDRMLPITDFARYKWIVEYMVSMNDFEWLPHITSLKFLNALSLGALTRGKPFKKTTALAQEFNHGFQEGFKQKTIDDWVSSDLSLIAPETLNRASFDWLKSFRDYQTQKLEMAGVKTVAYYVPPFIPKSYHAYAKAICSRYECLAMSDADLKESLSGPYWYNFTHVNEGGAKIYSRWMGRALVESLSRRRASENLSR